MKKITFQKLISRNSTSKDSKVPSCLSQKNISKLQELYICNTEFREEDKRSMLDCFSRYQLYLQKLKIKYNSYILFKGTSPNMFQVFWGTSCLLYVVVISELKSCCTKTGKCWRWVTITSTLQFQNCITGSPWGIQHCSMVGLISWYLYLLLLPSMFVGYKMYESSKSVIWDTQKQESEVKNHSG